MGELIVFIVVFYVIGKILKAIFGGFSKSDYHHCLLYTSDAADE